MSDAASRGHLPDSPYPGIKPFTYAHRDVFFAREGEARSLIRLVVLYRGVLLYSESGIGKSSLVNAALIPHAVAEGYQPEKIRVQPRKGEEIVVKRLSMETVGMPPYLPSLFVAEDQQQDVAVSIEEFLARLRQKANATYPLLIFDQFEEWVTLFEEGSVEDSTGSVQAIQRAILDVIVALLNDRELTVKLLIVLREDYLAKLAPLFERCPTLPDQHLRLTPLAGDQIYRTIRGPFEKYPGRYHPELSPSLAESIKVQFEERGKGAAIRLTEVQVVCQSLFEGGDEGSELEQRFVDLGGVQGILESYLQQALQLLPQAQQEPAVALLTRMVTAAGTRKRVSEDDLVREVRLEEGLSQEVVNESLGSLEQRTKLVRREPLRDVYYYEIASEFLVKWIQTQAHERELRMAARKAAQKEQEAARMRELAHATESAKRLRWLVVVLAVVLLLAVVAASLAIMQKGHADSSAATAIQAHWAAKTSAAFSYTREAEAVVARGMAESAATEAAVSLRVAQDTLGTREVQLIEQLHPSAEPTQLPPTDTPSSSGDATPSPTVFQTATPTPTADRGATATVQALEAALFSIQATQTAIAPPISPLTGDTLTQMTQDLGDEYVPSLSPDQRTLLVESNRTGSWQIFAIDLYANIWRQLTNQGESNFHPRYSPDGNRIIFSSLIDGSRDIYTMARDGLDLRRLTISAGEDSYPSYSDDGQTILFMSRRSGTWGVYAMNADGGEQRIVIDTEHDEVYPSLSPNGELVAFQSNIAGPWQIYTISIHGGEPRQLTFGRARDATPVFAEDGQSIVFETVRDGNYEIYIMNIDGSNQRNLTNSPGSRDQVPSVSPDGHWVLFQSNWTGNWDIFRVPLPGTLPSELPPLTTGG